MKMLRRAIIIIITLYLYISAVYVFAHIEFGTKPKAVGMGYSEFNNILRLFMGLPPTYSTYEYVSKMFLIEVIIKIIFATFLILYLRKKTKKFE